MIRKAVVLAMAATVLAIWNAVCNKNPFIISSPNNLIIRLYKLISSGNKIVLISLGNKSVLISSGNKKYLYFLGIFS